MVCATGGNLSTFISLGCVAENKSKLLTTQLVFQDRSKGGSFSLWAYYIEQLDQHTGCVKDLVIAVALPAELLTVPKPWLLMFTMISMLMSNTGRPWA